VADEERARAVETDQTDSLDPSAVTSRELKMFHKSRNDGKYRSPSVT
jgi:hypothetical protein